MMEQEMQLGQVIILNGAPRSGKSSIAAAIQEASNELWMNLGADRYIRITPEQHRPGVGLRPAGIEKMEEKPFALRKKIEPLVPVMYAAMYDSIAAHSRQGLNVVTDVGHHDDYASPRGILFDCARRMESLPVLFVGTRCPVEIVWERRRNTWLKEQQIPDDAPPPYSVHRWNSEVHRPGIYDLEVDTSTMSPEECGQEILRHLKHGPNSRPAKGLLRCVHRPEIAAIPAGELSHSILARRAIVPQIHNIYNKSPHRSVKFRYSAQPYLGNAVLGISVMVNDSQVKWTPTSMPIRREFDAILLYRFAESAIE